MRVIRIHTVLKTFETNNELYKDHFLSFYNRIVLDFDSTNLGLKPLSKLYTIRAGVNKDFKEYKEEEKQSYIDLWLFLQSMYNDLGIDWSDDNIFSNKNTYIPYPPREKYGKKIDYEDGKSVTDLLKFIYNVAPRLNSRAMEKINEMEDGLKRILESKIRENGTPEFGGIDDLNYMLEHIRRVRKKVIIFGAQRRAIKEILELVQVDREKPKPIRGYQFDWELVPEYMEVLKEYEKEKKQDDRVEVIEDSWERFKEKSKRYFHGSDNKDINAKQAAEYILKKYEDKDLPGKRTLKKTIKKVEKKKYLDWFLGKEEASNETP